MQTTPKANNILGHFFALLGAVVMLAIATWVSASSSEQVKPLDNLATPRTGHTATALSDGRILITGGRDHDGNLVAAAEIFDPETQTSSASGTLHTARVDHSATVLADGRVLVAGGTGASGALSSAEMFDPAHPENGFQTVGSSMSTARTRHTATLLNDGHVLIAGGDAQGSAELFDPATGTFMPTIWPLTVARSGHTATLFTDDNVLLAGGNSATMETYVPNQGFTLDVATMSVVRTGHWAFELSDTRLLLFQGDTGNTIDEFNPTTGTITPKGSLDFHASSSSLLANGKILVLGTDVSGLYDPNAVPPAPDFTAFDETSVPHSGILPRSGQAAVQLPGDKKILITGGVDANNQLLGQALFNPAMIWTDKDDYMPEEPVILSASGWKANEAIYLFAVDNETEQWTYEMTANADSNGEFVLSPYFIVELRHLGVQFHVTALGAQSTMQADVFFTDANPQTVTVVGAQTPNPVTPGNSATYNPVRVHFNGNGQSCTVNLTITTGLPAGATYTFSPSSVSGVGGSDADSILTVNVPVGATATSYTFTVQAAPSPGSCQNNGSATGNGTLVVGGNAATTTAVTSNSNPSVYGNSVTFTATVSSGSGTPTGNVTFYDGACGGTALTGAIPLVSGQASFSTSSLTAASHTIRACYTPTGSFQSSNGNVSQTVNTRPATWTTNANSKTYGDSDPVPLTTGSGSGFLVSDGVTATYSRAAGETVLGGPYHITATLSPSGALSNYSITNAGANFTINAKNATWTTNANSKTYGDSDPVPLTTGSGSGFLVSDGVTATYSRAAGETVLGGPYHITATLSPSGALSNYSITNAGANFTINAKNATWTTNANSKTYGDSDPVPLTTGSGSGFLVSDGVTATYSRAPGETVLGGPYHITATLSPAAVLTNYSITNAGADFAINTRPATWTTDPNSKTYGNADPNPLTTGSGDFLAADNVTATYSRAPGETVLGGPYHITATLSPAAVLTNYSITNAGADFAINTRPATWTTDPNSKTYGNADPNPLTTGSGDFLAADNVTATYSRAPGETVLGGPYHITATLSPAAVLTNYSITNAGASFAINTRPATWTTDPNSKTYGNADPNPLTTGSGDFLAADNVTATYSRAPGETVLGGPYHITATLSPAAVLTNYSITNAGADFAINTRPATWTTDPNSKTYGNADPNPLTTGSGDFLAADNVTATYSRAPGETVLGGPYHITATLSPAAVLTNYSITNAGASFAINTRPATWTTDPNSKTYGNADPNPLTTGSGDFLAADNVTATYSRAPGETVLGGPYHITATLSPAAVLTNYSITNAGADFAINTRPATWTTDPNSKTYGNADPNPLTTGSGDFLAADNVTATYSRAPGETVLGGPYHITATLSPAAVLTNYSITNAGADFAINTRPATWTTNAANKTYGNADPVPLTTGSGDFLAADNVTATYSRAPGETVLGGPYHITATLSPAAVLTNYSITNAGASFAINTRPATWTTDPNSKTYGNADPNPLTTGSGDFLAADNVTATYSRAPGETVLGGPYHITATLSPAAVLTNYSITNAGASFTINTRPATWTTNPASKTYGNADPVPLTAGSGSNFVAADNVTASYSRVSGETVLGGPYHITATLTPAAVLSNYSITNNGANFTINPATLTITATNRSKVFAATYAPDTTSPSVDFSVNGLVTGDSVASITLACAGYPAAALPQPMGYTITPSGAVGTGLDNYNIGYVTGTLTFGYGTCTGPNGAGGVILQPIDADGSSIFPKAGRTVPVKFTLCDANGNPISNPNAVFAGTGGALTMLSAVRGQIPNPDETAVNDIPDVAFRYSSGIWIFNMASSNLQSGYTYRFRINLANGQGITFQIAIK